MNLLKLRDRQQRRVIAHPAGGHRFGRWQRPGADRWLSCCLGLLLLAAPALLRAAEYRGFWIDTWHAGIRSQTEVNTLLGTVGTTTRGRIRDANCNSIFIEVRRDCDACYPSKMGEPYMSGLSPSTFNALQAVIDAAHDTTGGKKRIDVHAWIVTFRTSGGTVYSRHDDAPTGSLTTLDNYWPSRDDAGLEVSDKAFDPGHPLVLQYTVGVCMDLVTNYNIDGIHYDYVRFTAKNQGYNPTSIARYNARYGLTGQPLPDDTQFRQWRRDQVTELVRQVYARIQKVKPSVKQSGAFVTWNPSPTASTRTAFQATRPYGGNYNNNPVYCDWDGWMQEGIIDMAVPMTYYDLGGSYPDDFVRWMNFEKDRKFNRHMIIGPGSYLNSLSNSLQELKMIRTASSSGNYAHGFCCFSYFAPFTYGGTSYGTWTEFAPSFTSDITPTWDDIPTMPWKTAPTKGHIMGVVTLPSGAWGDGVLVTLSGPENRTMYADGTGFYAFIDLTPGSYTVSASKAGFGSAQSSASVAVGQVTGNMYERNLALCIPPFAPNRTYTRGAGMSLKIPLAGLGAGAPIASVGAGSQSATITFDSTNIYYNPQPGNTNPDSFTYRPVSPCATNGTITVNVVNVGGLPQSVTVSNNAAYMTFAGVPGAQYDVQRSLDLASWTIVNSAPITTPSSGRFNFTNTFTPPAPPAAYYRLMQH